MAEEPTVNLVDDDPSILKTMGRTIKSMGWNVRDYGSAQEFLDEFDPTVHGCIVLDIRLPGMSGLAIQQRLRSDDVHTPIIFVSGYADVPTTVHAMREGAIYLLEKPFREQEFLDCIALAIERDAELRSRLSNRAEAKSRLALLTRREREVLDLLVIGRLNKQAAAELNISERTVEAHRVKVMKKTRAHSVAELVRLAVTADLDVETTYSSTSKSIFSSPHN